MNNTEREKKFRKDFKPTLAKSLKQLQNIEGLRFVRVIGIYGTYEEPHFTTFELGFANEREIITLAKSNELFLKKEIEQIVEQAPENSNENKSLEAAVIQKNPATCEECPAKNVCSWKEHVQQDPAKVFEENDKRHEKSQRTPEYVT